MSNRWTVESGRGLCFDGRHIATIDRAVDKNSNYEIAPSDLDDLTHEIAAALNERDRVVRDPPHARFCKACERRNYNPGRVCSHCGCAIMVRERELAPDGPHFAAHDCPKCDPIEHCKHGDKP